jgi:hypothetical protein
MSFIRNPTQREKKGERAWVNPVAMTIQPKEE